MSATAPAVKQPVRYLSHDFPHKIWTLWFRYGNIPFRQKNFCFDGTMEESITRAREHCLKMGYRFICVRPFLEDLDEQELRKSGGNDNVD